MDLNQFKKLFDKTYMLLCMYALRILGDTDAADDAVQQAMITVWQRLADGYELDNPRAYLYRAVRNESLRILASSDSVRAEVVEAEDMTDDDIDTSERDAALWQAIDRLPDRCREIFLACKRDGLSYAEIAAEMDISVKTVEAQMSKALGRLREALSPYVTRRSRPFFLPFL